MLPVEANAETADESLRVTVDDHTELFGDAHSSAAYEKVSVRKIEEGFLGAT